jgi:hypothetical protein
MAHFGSRVVKLGIGIGIGIGILYVYSFYTRNIYINGGEKHFLTLGKVIYPPASTNVLIGVSVRCKVWYEFVLKCHFFIPVLRSFRINFLFVVDVATQLNSKLEW